VIRPISSLIFLAALTAGCSSSSDETKPVDVLPPAAATPVSANDFCAEVATIACSANDDCCAASETPSSSWPTADAGAPAESCELKQTAACRASVGELVTDPRTGYDPVAGGAFVAKLRTSAKGCWKQSVDYKELAAAFLGTGEPGATCTPEDSSSRALRISALSCKTGTSCHLYLRADGTPDGVCEAPADDSCSHPYDCDAGRWCELPSGWKPGVWGQCRPLRTAGWACSGDLQCASQNCDAAGKCAAPDDQRFCLTTPYSALVEADAPLAYLRLGEASGSSAVDASGNGNSGKRLGSPERASPGALTDDDDAATAFDGIDDGISLGAGLESDGTALGLELWFSIPEGTTSAPLLSFAKGPSLEIDDKGVLTLDLVDEQGVSHVLTDAGAEPKPGEWHHVVLGYDGYHASLVLDGNEVKSLDAAFTPATSGALGVGYRGDAHFAGNIDELAVYGSAVSLSRAREHRSIGKKGPARTFPVFHWFE
jgi:Concanavalin A-like lectin/glucanases superfamily